MFPWVLYIQLVQAGVAWCAVYQPPGRLLPPGMPPPMEPLTEVEAVASTLCVSQKGLTLLCH